ncbi:hypothetical protein Adt_39464 [Abeliophyllum distichum]|uniref:Uncharacterized protein n=1 Tax=Abeliophyllum distichum TaxID=126358 RepID=A0ABD1Q558_9LAMI
MLSLKTQISAQNALIKDLLEDRTNLHDICFSSTNANKNLKLVRSCPFEPLHTSLSWRKMITMQDSMALVNEKLERHLEHMDLQEVKRKADVASLKKEIDEMRSQANWLSVGARRRRIRSTCCTLP